MISCIFDYLQNETTTISSTSLQVSNEPANTENYTQETTQQIDTDDDDFF